MFTANNTQSSPSLESLQVPAQGSRLTALFPGLALALLSGAPNSSPDDTKPTPSGVSPAPQSEIKNSASLEATQTKTIDSNNTITIKLDGATVLSWHLFIGSPSADGFQYYRDGSVVRYAPGLAHSGMNGTVATIQVGMPLSELSKFKTPNKLPIGNIYFEQVQLTLRDHTSGSELRLPAVGANSLESLEFRVSFPLQIGKAAIKDSNELNAKFAEGSITANLQWVENISATEFASVKTKLSSESLAAFSTNAKQLGEGHLLVSEKDLSKFTSNVNAHLHKTVFITKGGQSSSINLSTEQLIFEHLRDKAVENAEDLWRATSSNIQQRRNYLNTGFAPLLKQIIQGNASQETLHTVNIDNKIQESVESAAKNMTLGSALSDMWGSIAGSVGFSNSEIEAIRNQVSSLCDEVKKSNVYYDESTNKWSFQNIVLYYFSESDLTSYIEQSFTDIRPGSDGGYRMLSKAHNVSNAPSATMQTVQRALELERLQPKPEELIISFALHPDGEPKTPTKDTRLDIALVVQEAGSGPSTLSLVSFGDFDQAPGYKLIEHGPWRKTQPWGTFSKTSENIALTLQVFGEQANNWTAKDYDQKGVSKVHLEVTPVDAEGNPSSDAQLNFQEVLSRWNDSKLKNISDPLNGPVVIGSQRYRVRSTSPDASPTEIFATLKILGSWIGPVNEK